MQEHNAVATPSSSSAAAEQATSESYAVVPAVDIREDKDGITLYADMPGVNSERLNVNVDKDTLLIEGDLALSMPEGMKPIYADIRSTRYRRSFALSSELDTAAISASFKDGVLTLRLPKRPEHQPRRIEVARA